MRLAGFLLLFSGWLVLVTALALFSADAPRAAFVLAGAGVEIVGMVLVIRSHVPVYKSKIPREESA